MNISQQQITYILSLIEQKNFGKAAEKCFVTQPTLSMQIKKAEESLGFQIFNRKRNPLELTNFGQQLVPLLYDMQAEYEKITRLTQINAGTLVEEIKIGVIPTIAAYLVPKLFEHKSKFSKKIKWAIIELKSNEILEKIQQKKIDFGIMAGPISEENIAQTPLFNEEILIYSTAFKNENQIHIEELKKIQPWLLNQGNCLRTQMMHFCKLNEENNSDWNYEGGNIEMLIQMVNQYGGYTLIPSFYKKHYQINDSLISHAKSTLKKGVPARNIVGISSYKNQKHPDLVELINFIKIEYSNQEMKNFEILSWK